MSKEAKNDSNDNNIMKEYERQKAEISCKYDEIIHVKEIEILNLKDEIEINKLNKRIELRNLNEKYSKYIKKNKSINEKQCDIHDSTAQLSSNNTIVKCIKAGDKRYTNAYSKAIYNSFYSMNNNGIITISLKINETPNAAGIGIGIIESKNIESDSKLYSYLGQTLNSIGYLLWIIHIVFNIIETNTFYN